MQKTFVLGLGAQKAGTTWLHQYLSSAENTDFGAVKEYHIWDAFNIPACAYTRVSLRAAMRGEPARQRFLMQRFRRYYFSYFANLIKPDDIILTGDITPSYSGLSSGILSDIRHMFERRGIAVKIVFLMRDPVERCWSAVRMNIRKNKRRENVDISLDDIQALRKYYKSDDAIFRTDYAKVMQNIKDAGFTEEMVYFGLYETMFETAEIVRLSDFFKVAFRPEKSQEKYNVSAKKNELPEDLATEIVDFYQPTYETCLRDFPITREAWSSMRYYTQK